MIIPIACKLTIIRLKKKQMKIFSKIVAISIIAGIAGCASSPMGETQYQMFGGAASANQKCFENNYLSPQIYADTKGAIRRMLQTWDYDENTLTSRMQQEYSNTHATQEFCRKFEGHAYDLIAMTRKHDEHVKESNKTWSDSLKETNINKPIFCNTIAGVTMCN